MNIYRIKRFDTDTPRYAATQAAAHKVAKEGMERRLLAETRIDMLDVHVDKDSIVELMNGNTNFPVTRTWRLSPRGSLIETTRGE